MEDQQAHLVIQAHHHHYGDILRIGDHTFFVVFLSSMLM
jgi:hypothetical protein